MRWILDQEGVSTVISGGRNTTQVKSNNQAADLAPPLPAQLHEALEDLYNEHIHQYVHDRWQINMCGLTFM